MEGNKRVDELMLPVLNAINRHVKDRDAKTDIYNRAYEAVKNSMDVQEDTRRENHKLRKESSELRRFVWWVHQVYVTNVMDTVAAINYACTYQDEPSAAAGKYGLPIKCFEMMNRLTEYSHGINDGTYLDNEISMGVKTSTDNNKGE
jgi:hypothetical protein